MSDEKDKLENELNYINKQLIDREGKVIKLRKSIIFALNYLETTYSDMPKFEPEKMIIQDFKSVLNECKL